MRRVARHENALDSIDGFDPHGWHGNLHYNRIFNHTGLPFRSKVRVGRRPTTRHQHRDCHEAHLGPKPRKVGLHACMGNSLPVTDDLLTTICP